MLTRQIVEGYFESLNKSDLWHKLIDNDMKFNGVRSQSSGKTDYVKTTEAFLRCVESVSIDKLVILNNEAAVIAHYILRSKSGKKGNIRIAEFFEVAGGQILTSTIFFDTAYFFEFINN